MRRFVTAVVALAVAVTAGVLLRPGTAGATNVNWSVKQVCGEDHYLHFAATVNNDHNEVLTFHIDGSSSWFGQPAAVAPGHSTNYPIGSSAYPGTNGSMVFVITASYPSGAKPILTPGNSITVSWVAGQCGATTTVPSSTTTPSTAPPSTEETQPPTSPPVVESTPPISQVPPAVASSPPPSPPAESIPPPGRQVEQPPSTPEVRQPLPITE